MSRANLKIVSGRQILAPTAEETRARTAQGESPEFFARLARFYDSRTAEWEQEDIAQELADEQVTEAVAEKDEEIDELKETQTKIDAQAKIARDEIQVLLDELDESSQEVRKRLRAILESVDAIRSLLP